MESLKNDFKWYPLEIFLPESTDLRFYGCQISDDLVMLTAVYNSDICTLCSVVKGVICEFEGKYIIDLFANKIDVPDIIRIKPEPTKKPEEKKEKYVIDGDKMTIREAKMEASVNNKVVTKDEYCREIIGFDPDEARKEFNKRQKELKDSKPANINEARLNNIIGSVNKFDMIEFKPEPKEPELIIDSDVHVSEDVKEILNTARKDVIKSSIGKQPKSEKINDEVVLTQGRDDSAMIQKPEPKKESSIFEQPKAKEKTKKVVDPDLNGRKIIKSDKEPQAPKPPKVDKKYDFGGW